MNPFHPPGRPVILWSALSCRLLQVIPVFLGTTLLVYYMVFALPGDPIAALFGDRQPPQAVIDTLRSQYHLDQPFWVQYGCCS